MAISDRITLIEEHIKESYQELEGLGIDTTGVNNNLENIPKLIDGYWETLPKVTGEGTSITLDNTKEGKMKINLKGNTSQEGTPTPEAPQDIHVVSGDNSIDIVGKNYFNKDIGEWSARYLTPTGTWGGNNSLMNIEFTKVEPNTTYTHSWEFGELVNSIGWRQGMWQFCDENKTPYSRNVNQVSTGDNSVTFTTDSNCHYVRVAYYALKKDGQDVTVDLTNHTYSDYIKNTQIEKGTEKTSFEEYKGASYPINLGDIELCKIGNYQDTIVKDNGKWYLNKQINKRIFNGTENWNYQSQYPRFQLTSLSPIPLNNSNLFCSHYIKGQTADTDYVCSLASGTGYSQFLVHDERFSTKETYNTWLSSNNVTLYYVLKTPTTTEITDSTLLSQLNALAKSYANQTNISQESNDLASILNATALREMS